MGPATLSSSSSRGSEFAQRNTTMNVNAVRILSPPDIIKTKIEADVAAARATFHGDAITALVCGSVFWMLRSSEHVAGVVVLRDRSKATRSSCALDEAITSFSICSISVAVVVVDPGGAGEDEEELSRLKLNRLS